MAKFLNKNRMAASRFLIVAAIILVLFTRQITESETLVHEILDSVGYILIVFCGMGRLYSTAYLGGQKNKRLITYGPFSIVRNPLYVFSWFGFTGIALFSNNLPVILLVPVGFLILYTTLVKREEGFLAEAFGPEYVEYCARVPRFIPRFSNFNQPAEITLTAHTFLKGLLDNVWWFAAPLAFELLEMAFD
jgi:protein-S-isoprenylcysteine O-methyltransferase Ste14